MCGGVDSAHTFFKWLYYIGLIDLWLFTSAEWISPPHTQATSRSPPYEKIYELLQKGWMVKIKTKKVIHMFLTWFFYSKNKTAPEKTNIHALGLQARSKFLLFLHSILLSFLNYTWGRNRKLYLVLMLTCQCQLFFLFYLEHDTQWHFVEKGTNSWNFFSLNLGTMISLFW